MNALARTVLVASFAVAVLAAAPAFAASPSELHITVDGKLTIKNAVVLQKSGNTLFCRATWGNAFVRMTILTTPDTVPALVLRNHGGTTTVDEIQQGDLVSIEGVLTPAADSLQVNAKRIVDYSLNIESKMLSGIIKSVDTTTGSFVLPNKTFGATTTVLVGTSTITKGARTITPSELAAKDKVLSITGSYDYTANTLAATAITIYQDKTVFLPRTFSGTIRVISGTTLPAMLTISTATADYQVYLAATAQVQSKTKGTTDLSRFAVGDKVSVFGTIRQTDLDQVDASIIRDLNF